MRRTARAESSIDARGSARPDTGASDESTLGRHRAGGRADSRRRSHPWVQTLSALGLGLVSSPRTASALPFGLLGGENSVIRVSDGAGCSPAEDGPVCGEATSFLPLADYASGGHDLVNASGMANPAAGPLSGSIQTVVDAQSSNPANIQLATRDTFTVAGPLVGEVVSITARLAVEATVQIDTGLANGPDVFAAFGFGPQAWDSTLGGCVGSGVVAQDNTNFGNVINQSGSVIPVDLEAVHTFVVTTGTPFELVYWTRANASANFSGSTTVDFTNTATLSFDLPTGYAITSDLGYSVPEPGTGLLIALVFSGLACARRRASHGGGPVRVV